ncbi:S8 family serine peptidase [Tenacibaculum singaporense]|uniref:Peptidase S8 n=1 Tax=Tenacibaculum singaporense TaxID=2358479 RepID=A0A3Q8RRH3_9FLAO|nr:S8 family serine peptidase [Tenacibaculum singaporense]AZJ34578.1 peptidase S8 [Tenacibaculum singaporense]
MRVLKPVFYSAIAVATLASCKTVSKIPVPAGSNTVVNIPAKKAELTDYEQENWQHLDLATDTIPGMSVNKAYEFLKGKKNVEVVVGVVDSGTDLKHEDLVDVAWVNTKEIPGDGIDNDKNGYVDDINGWNFLGDSYKEHLEYERILMKPEVASAELLAEVKNFHAKKVEEARVRKLNMENRLANVKKAQEQIKKHLDKDAYSAEEIMSINTKDKNVKDAISIAKMYFGYGFSSLKETSDYLSSDIKKSIATINEDNLKTDYRTVVGDNAYDINDKPGYGNGNIGHSEKDEAHGSHVSGIIGATRNNDKGMNGVANVKIMAVRSVSEGDEYDKDVALGIRYAVDNGAKVINTSFGKAFSPNKEWVYDAIKYAASKDVLIVNAAGNDGKNIDVEKTFPNDAPDLMNEVADNFLTIGAMSANYDKTLPANFSNYGKKNVDVFAPGVQVYSTTPDNEYKKFNGTSMASPAAAGVAALVRSYYPELTASQVKHILMNSGTKIDLEVVKPGTGARYGTAPVKVPFSELSVSGRVVNAYNAVRMADRMVNGRK